MSCGIAGDDPGTRRELAQEREAAGGRGIVDRARDEEAVAALLERPRRGDERAAARRCLDDDRGVGEAADDPVPARERAGGRLEVRRELGDDRAAGGDDGLGQSGVGPRIQLAVAAADDRDRPAAGVDGRGVRRAVDADARGRTRRSRRPRSGRARPAPRARGRRSSPAACPTTATACSAASAAGSPGRTAGAAAARSPRAGPGTPGRRPSPRAGRAADAVQRPVGVLRPPGRSAAATAGRQGPAAGRAVGRLLGRRGREARRPADRARDPQDVAARPQARSRPANPTGPSPSRPRGPPTHPVPRRDRAARSARRTRGPRPRPSRAVRCAPIAEHLSAPWSRRGAPPVSGTRRPRRDASRATTASPARSAMVRATRSSRSVPRPLAGLELRQPNDVAPGGAIERAGRSQGASGQAGVQRIMSAGATRAAATARAAAIRAPTTAEASGSGPTDDRRRRDPRHLDPQVDPVAKRARHPPLVALGDAGGHRQPRSDARRTARTRVHRGDQLEPGRKRRRPARPARSPPARPRAAGGAPRGRPRSNSGSSSRNSTPWSASVTSPGDSRGPPPTIAAYDIVWCGARNGGRRTSPSIGPSPAADATIVAASAASSSSGGSSPGTVRASMRLARPGRPDRAAGRGRRRARSRARAAPPTWPRTSARSGSAGVAAPGAGRVARPGPRPAAGRPRRARRAARPSATRAARRPDRSTASRERVDRRATSTPVDEPRLVAPRRGTTTRRTPRRASAATIGSTPGHRLDLAAERQLADIADAARPAPHLLRPEQDPDRDREVERGARLAARPPARG